MIHNREATRIVGLMSSAFLMVQRDGRFSKIHDGLRNSKEQLMIIHNGFLISGKLTKL
jgi:hypothetical protein